MRSSSDESDHETNKKRKHSDLNDSDCNIEFHSHDIHLDSSSEHDSADEGSSQSKTNGLMMDNELNCKDTMGESTRIRDETIYEPSRQYKRLKTGREDGSNDGKIHEATNKQEPTSDNNKVQRMMQKMGYEEGHGLGKNKQGRLEPVQASKQHGRRGLGHHIPGLEDSSLKWVPEEEEIKVVEDMTWIRNTNKHGLTLDEMQHWLQRGPKKLTIDDEFNFCSEDIVRNVVRAKTVFDNLDGVELRRARTRCNPYETIRGAFFLNRAAVKMANMDRACNFMFTKPAGRESTKHHPAGRESTKHHPAGLQPENNELLYFADVCAGPGGFSEYVLWRKKWRAKGFGFTLKNENDFKLADFYAGPCETFHPYYGPKDDGDVYDPSNQEAFRNLIMTHTRGKGVHFMMSDGGFSVEGQENIQEILSKQLYLCQCLVALMIVREKGHFVTKLFDVFTPFSAGLVYLMYRCFEEVCIFKPNSSRPANSERYLICKYKRPGTEAVVRHLVQVNEILLEGDANDDVVQLVSMDELEREQQFLQYLRESNEVLGRKQVIGLCKIAAFCEDSTLVEVKQAEMRTECLKYWDIPDESRTVPRKMKPKEKLNQLLKSTTFLCSTAKKLTKDNIESTILTPYDWFCMPCGTGPTYDDKNATFYMGLGRRNVYRYVKNNWELVDDITIDLPPDTLLYAEVLYEMKKEFKHMQKVLALHILDAYFLGGENISQKYLRERHELTKQLCEALWKPMGNICTRIRVKELFRMDSHICRKLQVTERRMKNSRIALTHDIPQTFLDCDSSENDKLYFIPNSVIFLKSTAGTWNRYLSTKHPMSYVFNSKTGETKCDEQRPTEAEAGFEESFDKRIIWYWPNDESLTVELFAKFIKKKCREINFTLQY